MKKIAKFHKVSFSQFYKDYQKCLGEIEKSECFAIYEELSLPKRATRGSAGYDFYLPCAFVLKPKESLVIPTGMRVEIENGWVLQVYPRSGLGFKYRLQLSNTVGIIDSDYFYSDNEGHILVKLTNASYEEKEISLSLCDRFAQGVFMAYGITYDDEADEKRNGGFGSTNK